MTTTLTETAPSVASSSRARRTTSRTPAAPSRRARRPRLEGEAIVASLADMVDRLIKENRELKRAVARAQSNGAGGGLGQSAKILAGLQRRVYRSLTVDATPGRRRRSGAATAAVTPRPRRKVTDPEVLERRRQALAKARAVRAAKRQEAAEQKA
jgi:hypothetical protein